MHLEHSTEWIGYYISHIYDDDDDDDDDDDVQRQELAIWAILSTNVLTVQVRNIFECLSSDKLLQGIIGYDKYD